MMRRFVFAVLLVIVALLVTAAWFPARWAVVLAGQRLTPLMVEGVHGTLWSGTADRLSWAGQPLGRLRWSLSRGEAMLGDIHGHVELNDPRWHGQADFRLVGRREVHVTGLQAEGPVSLLRPYLATHLQPDGRLQADFSEVQVRDGWPVKLAGVLRWQQAALDVGDGAVALGNLYARLEDRAGTRLLAQLGDDGQGPLIVQGQADATPLGWRLEASLAARDDGNRRLRELLRRFGSLDNAGRLHVRTHGGLTMGAER